MSNLSDIVNKYLLGDNTAVAELYSLLKDRLFLLAYNCNHDKEASQDFVQELFEKMILLSVEKRNEYFGSSEDNIEGYLAVAIKNRCKDFNKKKSNREKILCSVEHLFIMKVENNSLEKFYQDGLREMINNLQPREQEIIRLHLKGFRNEEIATNLTITYNTVKNNLYESKKKLKKMWKLFMT